MVSGDGFKAAPGRKAPVPLRLLVLVSHPIQYFVPVYRALSARQDIELTVVFHCRVGVDEAWDAGFQQSVRWDIPLLEGFRCRFLSSRRRIGGLHLGVVRTLVQLRPDVVMIHGYNQLTNLLALGICKILGIRTLLRGDARLLRRHVCECRVLRWLRKKLIQAFDGCLSIGSPNRSFYLAHGATPRSVFHAPLCVDNDRFALIGTNRAAVREEKRRALGIGKEEVVVFFASKLTRQKRVRDLFAAFVLAVRQCHALFLLIAGSGEEENWLREQIVASGLDQKVRLLGFVNQAELPRLYAASDICVLPSEEEEWGLVVNEAMSAGLPVVVSDGVGAAADLVEGQGTGIIYPVGDIAALADALARLGVDQELRAAMGERAREVIGRWDVAACVDGIVQAVHGLAARG